MNSLSEENYLKAIYKLEEKQEKKITTNAIAAKVETAPASVTDMLKRLSDKKLVHYEKYKGVSLTAKGRHIAVNIIRKHRLWEFFLVEKLGFTWDEVHDIAEQLEHIKSDVLVEKLNVFLGHPKYDPHGDPIPDEKGNFHVTPNVPLSEVNEGQTVVITGVIDHHPSFLKYLDSTGLSIGKKVNVKELIEYDRSMDIVMNKTHLHISHDVAKNLLVNVTGQTA